MKYVFLVSCVKKKQKCRAPAKELYCSDLFKKSRKLAEATKCPWFIVSAKHHLLRPGKTISPYEKTLNKMYKKERKDWAEKVRKQMLEELPRAEAIVLLTSKRDKQRIWRYTQDFFQQIKKLPVLLPQTVHNLRITRRIAWAFGESLKCLRLPCESPSHCLQYPSKTPVSPIIEALYPIRRWGI